MEQRGGGASVFAATAPTHFCVLEPALHDDARDDLAERLGHGIRGQDEQDVAERQACSRRRAEGGRRKTKGKGGRRQAKDDRRKAKGERRQAKVTVNTAVCHRFLPSANTSFDRFCD